MRFQSTAHDPQEGHPPDCPLDPPRVHPSFKSLDWSKQVQGDGFRAAGREDCPHTGLPSQSLLLYLLLPWFSDFRIICLWYEMWYYWTALESRRKCYIGISYNSGLLPSRFFNVCFKCSWDPTSCTLFSGISQDIIRHTSGYAGKDSSNMSCSRHIIFLSGPTPVPIVEYLGCLQSFTFESNTAIRYLYINLSIFVDFLWVEVELKDEYFSGSECKLPSCIPDKLGKAIPVGRTQEFLLRPHILLPLLIPEAKQGIHSCLTFYFKMISNLQKSCNRSKRLS